MRWSHYFAQLSVCATVLLAPFAAQAASEDDPWESVNRPIFTFNDTVDTYALKPIAQGYQFVTPQFVQDGVHNFFRNIGDVGNLANNVLQAKPAAAGVDLSLIHISEPTRPLYISYAVFQELRSHRLVALGQGFERVSVEHIVELVNRAVDAFPRIIFRGCLGNERNQHHTGAYTNPG